MKILLNWRKPAPGEAHTEHLFGMVNYFLDYRNKSGVYIINIRRCFLVLLLALSPLYFGGAGWLYWKEQRKPFSTVTPADYLLPHRWAGLDRKTGRRLLKEGRALFKRGNDKQAQFKLAAGLGKCPGDMEARLILARLLHKHAYHFYAEQVIEEGLDYGFPPKKHLEFLFDVAFSGQNHELVLRVTGRLLGSPETRGNPPVTAFLIKNRVQALVNTGRYQDAIRLAREFKFGPESSLDEVRLEAQSLINFGRYAEAIALLRRDKESGGTDPASLKLLAEAYRQAGNYEALENILEMLRQSSPETVEHRIFALRQWHLSERPSRFQEVFEDIIGDFKKNNAALLKLVRELLNFADSSLVFQCLQAAREQNFDTKPFILAWTDSLLEEGRWREAAEAFSQRNAASHSLPLAETSYVEQVLGYLLCAVITSGENSAAQLLDYLQREKIPLRVFIKTSRILQNAQKINAALDTLKIGTEKFPKSISLAEALAETRKLLLTKLKKEKQEKEKSIDPILQSAPAALAKIDQCLETGGTLEGLRVIRGIHAQKPPWLAAEEETLAWKQLLLLLAGGDRIFGKSAITSYLGGNEERGRRLLGLARAFRKEGKLQQARMIADAILAQTPQITEASAFISSLILDSPVFISANGETSALLRIQQNQLLRKYEARPEQVIEDLDRFLDEGEYRQAKNLIRNLNVLNPVWIARIQDELQWREVLLAIHEGDSAEAIHLSRQYLNEDPLRGQKLASLAEKHMSLARSLASEVAAQTPQVKKAASLLQSFTLSGGPPAPPAKEEAPDALDCGNPDKTLAHLDGLISTRQRGTAQQFLDRLRGMDPPWMKQHTQALDEAQLRIIIENGNPAASQVALNTYLEKNSGAARRLMALARQYREKGEDDWAKLIADTLVERMLDEDSATALDFAK